MGNRAVITFDTNASAPCIYLHWNGGRASVEGFLQAAKAIGIDQGDITDAQQMDDFADLIANKFFGNPVGMTCYRESYGKADTDNYDNGVYIINRNFEITGRKFAHGEEISDFKTAEIALAIRLFDGPLPQEPKQLGITLVDGFGSFTV